jgi:hypothetical protein
MAWNTEIKRMKSGMLNVYNADYFEYSIDGYLQNNSMIALQKHLSPVTFDTEEDIDTYTCGLYKINEDRLRAKTILESKVRDLIILQNGNSLYNYEQFYNHQGIYRFKIIVTPLIGDNIPFWSDIFCVNEEETDNYIFLNGNNYTFLNGSNYKFIT